MASRDALSANPCRVIGSFRHRRGIVPDIARAFHRAGGAVVGHTPLEVLARTHWSTAQYGLENKSRPAYLGRAILRHGGGRMKLVGG